MKSPAYKVFLSAKLVDSSGLTIAIMLLGLLGCGESTERDEVESTNAPPKLEDISVLEQASPSPASTD